VTLWNTQKVGRFLDAGERIYDEPFDPFARSHDPCFPFPYASSQQFVSSPRSAINLAYLGPRGTQILDFHEPCTLVSNAAPEQLNRTEPNCKHGRKQCSSCLLYGLPGFNNDPSGSF
jgi:hypothetical protein